MSRFFKTVKASNIAVVIIQFCVLGFQIYRWNEIVGSSFSIVVSLASFAPIDTEEKWFLIMYITLISIDFVFQLVNMIVLICFQWTVIQFCINLNVAVELPAGVSCDDWWHFGYGEINYRDRSLIVTILLAVVVLIRLVQIVLTFGASRKRTTKSVFFTHRQPKIIIPSIPKHVEPGYSQRHADITEKKPKQSGVKTTTNTSSSQGLKVHPLPYQQRYPRPHSVTTVA